MTLSEALNTNVPFRQAYHTDVTVQIGVLQGLPPEDIIVALVKEKETLVAEILKIHSILPRKILLTSLQPS